MYAGLSDLRECPSTVSATQTTVESLQKVRWLQNSH